MNRPRNEIRSDTLGRAAVTAQGQAFLGTEGDVRRCLFPVD